MGPYEPGTDSETIEYEPVSVKDLLAEMKDTSELLVDLAYSAILHNSGNIAEEVLELESKMDLLQMQARMSLLMSARNPAEAEQLAPVLGVVGAAEKISNAAGDIADVVLGEIGIPEALRSTLPEAMEVLVRTNVSSESTYANRTLGSIDLETETGVHVLALRRHSDWFLNPDNETTLTPADILLLRGPEASIADVYETLSGTSYEPPPSFEHDIPDLERAVDTIVLMKNVSELAVDLAYASVLYDNEELAKEVHELEVEIDALQDRLEAWTLQAAADVDDPVSLRGLIHLAGSTEVISDAALEITEGVLRDIDTHPVIEEAVRESDEIISRFLVTAGSEIIGRSVGDLTTDLSGITVIAIHRVTEEWVFYPDESVTIHEGDTVIGKGTPDAELAFHELTVPDTE